MVGSERQLELSFEPTAAAYVMLVDLLVEDHPYDEAFLVAEKAKARTLLDLLGQERSNAARDILPKDLADAHRLRENVVENNANPAAKKVALANLANCAVPSL